MYGLHAFMLFHLLTWLGQNALGSEIINGEIAPKNSMQYMASVQVNKIHVCGGFLVREDFVVTAAHCDKPNLTRVVLGTHNLKKVDNDAIRKIAKKCKHPSYEDLALGYDIMLLQLSKKAQLNNRVKVVKLPRADNKIKDMENCSVAGWGFTKSRGKTVDDLHVVDVPIIKLDECKRKWKSIRMTLPANVICAGGSGTNKGFCEGDSGGPLVCNGMAVGVVSFNMKHENNCDYPNVPNIYTDISKHLDWIHKILKNKKC